MKNVNYFLLYVDHSKAEEMLDKDKVQPHTLLPMKKEEM